MLENVKKQTIISVTMKDQKFEIEKTFGLGVLLKLTKKNINGIQISSHGNKFVSNVNIETLREAVEATLKTHRIHLKCE